MKKMLVLLFTVTLCCSAGVGAADTYDYTADFAASFTDPSNPYGVWEIGYYTIGETTTWSLYTDSAPTATLNVWRYPGEYNSHGNAVYNWDTADFFAAGADDMCWRAGQPCWMSPETGNDMYRPGSRFTAPETGTYDIAITFQNNVQNGDSSGVYVNIGDAEDFNAVISGFNLGTTDLVSYTKSVYLAQGQTVTFGNYIENSIDSNGIGNGYHQVGVNATFTIPEPMTIGLLGLGGLALLRRRR